MHLKYFDAKGAAETIRFLMALGGAEYTDERYSLDLTKKPPFGEDFRSAQNAGEMASNLDRVPVLIVGGTKAIGQSKAIERYVARRVGLMGADDIEAAMIDAITEHVRDLKDKYKAAKKEEDTEKGLATFFDKTMPDFMEKLEKVLGEEVGCAVGTKISLADVYLSMFITEFFDKKEGAAASISNCPKISASVAAVATHPAIVAWIATRPQTAI